MKTILISTVLILSLFSLSTLNAQNTFGEYLSTGSATTRGLWHLDGNSNDVSGNGNNGTDANVTYSLTNGRFGQGAAFNGSSSMISMADVASLKPTGNLTVVGWALPTSTATNKVIVSNGFRNDYDPSWCWYFISVESNGYALFQMFDRRPSWNEYKSIVGTTVLTDGKFHCIIGTYDGNYLRLYVDGKQEAISTQWTRNLNWYGGYTSRPRIGCSSWGGGDNTQPGDWFNGKIDEVIIESRTWSDVQIAKYITYTKGRFGM
ncbi:MAG: LamG domain-containing protein [Bacteroidetes bacterium]|nr:LamG domain-containing protein [Bacteroidota bacterium]